VLHVHRAKLRRRVHQHRSHTVDHLEPIFDGVGVRSPIELALKLPNLRAEIDVLGREPKDLSRLGVAVLAVAIHQVDHELRRLALAVGHHRGQARSLVRHHRRHLSHGGAQGLSRGARSARLACGACGLTAGGKIDLLAGALLLGGLEV